MKRARKALLRGLAWVLLLGAVLALANPAQVLARLEQAHPGWLLAGLVAAIASNLVSALRWRALARWLGAHLSAADAGRWYFQAIGLNALLPGAVLGGDVYRAMVLRRAGHDTLASSWSVLLDRLSGLWMLCAIGGLGAGALALGVQQPLAVWAFAIAPIFLMAALPVSVGGWGTREAAAVAALAPFGVAAPAAVGVGMIYGLYGLAQGALGALAFGLPRRAAARDTQKNAIE